MALSSTFLLPPLYEVQKHLQDAYLRYGTPIQMAGDSPSEQRIQDILSKMGQSITMYHNGLDEVKNVRDTKVSRARAAFAIFISIMVVIGIACCGIVYSYFESGTDMGGMIWFAVFMILFFIAIFYLLYSGEKYYQTLKSTYETMYNTSLSAKEQQKSYHQLFYDKPEVKKVLQMLERVSENDKAVAYRTTNIPLVYSFVVSQPITRQVQIVGLPATSKCASLVYLDKDTKNTCGLSFLGSKSGCSADKNTLKVVDKALTECNFDAYGEVAKPHGTAVYPFIRSEKMEIDPFVLKRELQSLDPFGQIGRMRDAMVFFQSFMLKKNDGKYGADTSSALEGDSRNAILDTVAKLLYGEFGLVSNMRMLNEPESKPFESSEAECYKTCLQDPKCSVAKYDAAKKMCRNYNATEVQDPKKFGVAYDAQEANPLLVKYSDKRFDVLGAEVNTEYFSEIGINKETDTGAGSCYAAMDPGCVMDAMGNTWKIPNGKMPQPTLAFRNEGFAETQPSGRLVTTATELAKTGQRAGVVTQIKDFLADDIVRVVVERDPNRTFLFSQDDINYITRKLTEMYGTEYSMYTGIVNDILSQVPDKLAKAYKEGEDGTMTADEKVMAKRYIPYDRFLEKLKDMSSKDWVVQFLHNANELRNASAGLLGLYNNFSEPYNRKMQDFAEDQGYMTKICFGIFFGIAAVAYLVHDGINLKKCTGKAVKGVDCSGRINKFSMGNVANEVPGALSMWVDFGLKAAVIFMLVVIPIVLFHGQTQKNTDKFYYNRDVYTNNGRIVVNNADSIMTMIDEDYKNKAYTVIKESLNNRDTSYMAYKEFKSGKIIVSPFSSEDRFDALVKRTKMDTATKFGLASGAKPHNLEDVYLSLLQLMEAYEKCNNLFMLEEDDYPVPIVTLAVYGIAFVIILITLLIVMGMFKPHSNLYMYFSAKNMLNRIDKGYFVSTVDVPMPPDAMTEWGKLVAKGAMIVIITITVILLAILITGSANNFRGSLYGSELFRQSQCYDL